MNLLDFLCVDLLDVENLMPEDDVILDLEDELDYMEARKFIDNDISTIGSQGEKLRSFFSGLCSTHDLFSPFQHVQCLKFPICNGSVTCIVCNIVCSSQYFCSSEFAMQRDQ